MREAGADVFRRIAKFGESQPGITHQEDKC